MRLSPATAHLLPAEVSKPAYDRTVQRSGIVHFGIGAFHRAHQAVYTDDAMNAGERDWSILGVSLRSCAARDRLDPQEGLYTVTQKSNSGARRRLIGSLRRVWAAPRDHLAICDSLASPDTRVVSFTITEKGYHGAADGSMNTGSPDLLNDLAEGRVPRTLYGFLTRSFRARMRAGLPGITLISCDNLADNGGRLARLMEQFIERKDRDLAGWFRRECSCPSTMVDRITPAVTTLDRKQIDEYLGVRDAAPVVTEPFSQWIIEDRFAGPRPTWEIGGASVVSDVRPYETAKLRMLNGAHSALAYLGLARGHQFVHQAIADPVLRTIVEQQMQESASTVTPAHGQDLCGYARTLMNRFANDALPHPLSQIAMDGSQKIPQRWLAVLRDRERLAMKSPALLQALAAWMVYVRAGAPKIVDPMAQTLAHRWTEAGSAGIVDALFGPGGLFADSWTGTEDSRAMLTGWITQARSHPVGR